MDIFCPFFLDKKGRKNQERMMLNGASDNDRPSVLYAILSALFFSRFALTFANLENVFLKRALSVSDLVCLQGKWTDQLLVLYVSK
jgi:hypothetical protein